MEELIWRVERGLASEEEQAKLREWRRESVHNEQFCRDFVRVLQEAKAIADDEVDRMARPPLDRILSRVTSPGSEPEHAGARPETVPPSARRWRTGRGRRILAGSLAVAAGATGIGLGLWLRSADPSTDFRLGTGEIITGASETTTVKLGDGSTVRLAPGSRLLISDDPDTREVWLDGRAYFAVRHLDGIPFRVRSHAGDAVVLGTRFDLQASPERLRVLVVEGAVELSDRQVAADGLQVEASQIGQVAPSSPPVREAVDEDVLARELGWLGDFLVFEGTPLSEVAAELGRHFGTPVEILDDRLAAETVRALFFEESFEEVVEVICRALAARCSVQPGGAIIGP